MKYGAFIFFGFLTCFVSSVSMAQFQLGTPGRDGQNGRDGRTGYSATDTTLFAGESVNLNLDGSDGESGENGEAGMDAHSCYMYHYPDYDLRAADGGDGGHGGRGGDGGRGANVTIYAQDISLLKKIYVSSRGGRGGQAGMGQRGGNPCYCPVGSWQFAYTCRINNRDQTCYRTHYCYPGRQGNNGGYGQNGRDGSLGHLTLIPANEPLPEERPNYSAAIVQMLEVPITLTKHLWEERVGAINLLASGSYLDNRYTVYRESRMRTFSIEWKVEGTHPEDSGLSGQLLFDGSKDILNLSGDALTLTQRTTGTERTTYSITQFYRGPDIRNLRPVRLYDRERNAKLFIQNATNLGMVGAVSIHLEIKKKKFLHNDTLFAGVVPEQAWSRTAQGFVVNVGQISEEPEDNYDEDGDKYEVILKITRSLGHSQTVYESGEVKMVLE